MKVNALEFLGKDGIEMVNQFFTPDPNNPELFPRVNIKEDDTITVTSACKRCGRKLSDPVSMARGMGPVCARFLTLPNA